MPEMLRWQAIVAQFQGCNDYIINKCSTAQIKEIFTEAVLIEQEFITQSIPCSMIGMNKTLISNSTCKNFRLSLQTIIRF